MFGYVQPDKEELKLREHKIYRAYYCGLCHVLRKKYGAFAKFLLNYDCTFLALVLSLTEGANRTWIENGRCPVHPFRKAEPQIRDCKELHFAAALNVILGYYSLEDKWLDDRNVLAWAAMLFCKSALKKARRDFPNAEEAVKSGLARLHATEDENAKDVDRAANDSAAILSEAVCAYDFTDDTDMHIMKVMSHNLGRWIYIADAWCDREKDKKKHSYNPVNLQNLTREQVMHLMYTALACAKDAFDLLNIDFNSEFAPVADNVFTAGCVKVTESILTDSYKNKN
ncbi:MAG: hypothetical protein IJO93_00880 [Clostridia bacterium]|nr:hypothetical protein [Clostridia bacterium]